MKRLRLKAGTVKLSDYDFARVRKFHWWTDRRPNGRRYARGFVGGRRVYMHCFILGFPEFLIDHHNRDGLDNRRRNLRRADKSKNAANAIRSIRNTSGYKGVGFHPETGKWRASIIFHGRRVSLGLHFTRRKAAVAYARAARKLQKQFARTKQKGTN